MKVATVINNGSEQSIRLPDDCHIESSEVYVKRLGGSLVLIPKDIDPWKMFIQGLDCFTEDFMPERGQQSEQDQRTSFE